MINKTNLLVLALLAGLASSLEHEKPHKDGRCRCICPSLKDALPLFNASQVNELVLNRQIYIESTEPDACGCDQVVLPRILDDPGVLAVEEALQLEQKFCPRCVCMFETRNTTMIKVVVILILCIISLLVLYMAFLHFIYPYFAKHRTSAPSGYKEQLNQDDDTGEGIFEPAPTDSELGFVMRTRPLGNSMFHRVGAQQSKWHRTVQEQRRNIYDRHSMLN